MNKNGMQREKQHSEWLTLAKQSDKNLFKR